MFMNTKEALDSDTAREDARPPRTCNPSSSAPTNHEPVRLDIPSSSESVFHLCLSVSNLSGASEPEWLLLAHRCRCCMIAWYSNG
jgi:hypothetical protein